MLCFVEPYLEVEDAEEIESTVVNLNPRIDTVVYHHHYPELELASSSSGGVGQGQLLLSRHFLFT